MKQCDLPFIHSDSPVRAVFSRAGNPHFDKRTRMMTRRSPTEAWHQVNHHKVKHQNEGTEQHLRCHDQRRGQKCTEVLG